MNDCHVLSDMMKVEKRKKMERRQTQQQEDCFVDYAQLSCYPTAETRIMQDQWGKVSSMYL